MANKAIVSLVVSVPDVAPYQARFAVFSLAESSETKSGAAVSVTLEDENGKETFSVEMDPAVFLDVSDLLLEAVNAAGE